MSEPVADGFYRVTAEALRRVLAQQRDPLADQLDNIEQRCLQAVLAGGTTWTRFMADAERETGFPWVEIKRLLDERNANRAAA